MAVLKSLIFLSVLVLSALQLGEALKCYSCDEIGKDGDCATLTNISMETCSGKVEDDNSTLSILNSHLLSFESPEKKEKTRTRCLAVTLKSDEGKPEIIRGCIESVAKRHKTCKKLKKIYKKSKIDLLDCHSCGKNGCNDDLGLKFD